MHQENQTAETVINIIRYSGLYFMALGCVAFFNLFDIASFLQIESEMTMKLIGSVFFAIGLVDFAVLPDILKKKWK